MEVGKIAEESARGSFYLMVGSAASAVIGAVGVVVIARLLGPAGYGLYVLAWVLPTLFVSIADIGVNSALTRYAANLRSQHEYEKLASMIGSGLLFKLIGGSVASLLALGFSAQLAGLLLRRQEIEHLVALASLAIVFHAIFNLSCSTFNGLDRMEQTAGVSVLRNITRVVLSAALIIVGFGVAGAVVGQTLSWTVAGLLGVWLLLAHRRVLQNSPGHTEESGFTENTLTMMRYGLPLYFGSLLTTLFNQYQNIVLAFFTSNAEIGNLNAAVNFSALILVVATPVATALFPAFSKVDLQTRKDELKRMFELSVRYTTLLILPVAAGVGALSKDLIRVIYGAAYGNAAAYLTLYVGIFLLAGLGYYVVANFLNGIGRTREALKMGVVQLAVFLPAAPAMAWLYSVPGLILALILSALVAISFGLRLATRKYGMQVNLKGSLAALAAALVSALPILPLVYYSPLPSLGNVLIGVPIYLVAYLTFAPVFKAVTRSDLQILSPMLSQIKMLRPVINLILTYETLVLAALDRGPKR